MTALSVITRTPIWVGVMLASCSSVLTIDCKMCVVAERVIRSFINKIKLTYVGTINVIGNDSFVFINVDLHIE